MKGTRAVWWRLKRRDLYTANSAASLYLCSRGPTLQQHDVDQVRPQGSLGLIHCHWRSTLRATVLYAQLSMSRPTETSTTPRASNRRVSCKNVYVMASPPPPSPPLFFRKVTIAGAMHRPRVGSLDTIGELIPEESNELTAGTVIDVGGVQVRTVLYGDGLGEGALAACHSRRLAKTRVSFVQA